MRQRPTRAAVLSSWMGLLIAAPGATAAGAAPAAPAESAAQPAGTATAPAGGQAAAITAMTQAAQRFLAALGPAERQRAAHPFPEADRQSFKYVPMARTGVPLKALGAEQRKLAHGLLQTGLSAAGYKKVGQVIELERVLAELEKNPVRRDPELYYFWVFGSPAPGATWGWKMEGHHLSFNFTVVKGNAVASVPTFMGANPAEVKGGPLDGRRVLRGEEDLARDLVRSFDAATRRQVVFDAEAPAEIFSADRSQIEPLPALGLAAGEMKPAQRELLRRLLAELASTLEASLAQARLKKIDQAGFEKVRFAWAGTLERPGPHYYRIQGPTFLIEYDNTQNDANHIHTVWRDFNGDFGRDLLREHRAQFHGPPAGAKNPR